LAAFNGRADTVFVDRAIVELRCGRVVRVNGGDRSWLMSALECCPESMLEELKRLSGDRLELIVSGERALALGLSESAEEVMAVRLPEGWDCDWLHKVAATPFDRERGAGRFADVETVKASWGAEAAITLAKQAHLVPAVVLWELTGSAATEISKQIALGDILFVTRQQISDYAEATAVKLLRVGEARVPLAGCEDTRFVVFRAASSGTDHVAIMIGEVDEATPVLVRLHSACLTGDLFGSLRCDCGEQLRSSVESIAEAGGGIILYLAQEGRGIGLANKIRAYGLQDQGFDTLDANKQLGFKDDERRYEVAAEMLKMLEIHHVTLMTNNPGKMEALRKSGITIERVFRGLPRAEVKKMLHDNCKALYGIEV